MSSKYDIHLEYAFAKEVVTGHINTASKSSNPLGLQELKLNANLILTLVMNAMYADVDLQVESKIFQRKPSGCKL